MLMASGADPSVLDGNGLSPIHVAALHGHSPLILFLSNHGGNINVQDKVCVLKNNCKLLQYFFRFCVKGGTRDNFCLV